MPFGRSPDKQGCPYQSGNTAVAAFRKGTCCQVRFQENRRWRNDPSPLIGAIVAAARIAGVAAVAGAQAAGGAVRILHAVRALAALPAPIGRVSKAHTAVVPKAWTGTARPGTGEVGITSTNRMLTMRLPVSVFVISPARSFCRSFYAFCVGVCVRNGFSPFITVFPERNCFFGSKRSPKHPHRPPLRR